MKYRTKLYVALVGTAVISTALGLGIAYVQVKEFILKELRGHVMSIAAAAAANLDGDQLALVRSKDDEHSVNYNILQKQLRAIRDVNRREDVYVKFVYTLIPYKDDPKRFYFQVDAEEDTPDFSHFGDEVPDALDSNLGPHIKEVYSPAYFIYNQWGVWMTGFAPIYDKNGNYVATLGVDLRAEDVINKLQKLLTFGTLSFLSALTLALLAAYFLSRQETISLRSLSKGVKEIGDGKLNTRIHLNAHDEFDELAETINHMAHGLEERERLMQNFTRYVSQHIMETILKTTTPVKLEGERRKITLLFSDIRQFTTLSEALAPESVVSLLNEYFAVMVEIIFKNQGTLDKFLGDGMMVEFGVPIDDINQELHAVKTAIEMHEALNQLCKKWEREGKPRIKIGVGIHTGIAIVGNIGSERRIEYTAIGDTVNIAARLEQLTKELKKPIIISETTVEPIQNQFIFERIGAMPIRGRTDPIVVYSLAVDGKTQFKGNKSNPDG